MTEINQFGRYEIRSLLGRGGMASVYLAFDPRFQREVALKVLPRELMHDPQLRERFNREARTIARLEHYAIVPVYDFGDHDGQLYLVMRYMSGGSLEDRIKNGPYELTEVAPVLARLADALDYSHGHGVIHRDLKPGNILFDNQENAFLSDFGIAKLAESTTNLTGSGIIGTSAYMSPEQVKGGSQLDGRSDIYALGIILFQMLTGEIPYKADTPVQQLMAHVLEPVPNILDVRNDLPAQCESVVSKAMAKSRDDRFDTAGSMAQEISQIATKEMARPSLDDAAEKRPEPEAIKTEVLTHFEPPVLEEPAEEPESEEKETAVPTSPEPPELYIPEELLVKERPLSSEEPEAPASKQNIWLWVGGGVLLLVILLGIGYLWRAGQEGTAGDEAQPDSSATAMGAYIQEQWDSGKDLTSLAYGSGVWGAILSDQAGLGVQTWHVTGDSPKAFIESKWEEGFDVTSLAYGDGHWVVVLSDGADLGTQTWHYTPDSPISYVQEMWNRGYDVTSLAYGSGGWAIIFSNGSHLGQQNMHLTADSPLPYIQSMWDEGDDLTSLAYGGGRWGIIMSSTSDLGSQTFQRTPESPVSYIKENWAKGLDVTTLTYGDGTWAIVMSDRADLGDQIWQTKKNFR
jgi:serine/threonine protein kinase